MKKSCRRNALMTMAVLGALSAGRAGAAMFADTPPVATQPATQETQGPLKVTVADVTGNVQVRTDEKAAWQAAKVGMVVDEGAEFRTGPRSSVRCTIPPDQSFTL